MKTRQQLDRILKQYTDRYIRDNTDMYFGTIQLDADDLRILLEYAWMYKEVSK